jgi:hypothetical protein
VLEVVMSKWFYEKAGAPAGPYSEREMRDLCESSVLRPHTRIRREGATEWVELEKAGLDLSEAAHTVRPAAPSASSHPRRSLAKVFPPPADAHGPHFSTHGGRIEFHAACRERNPECLKLVALVLLLLAAAGGLVLWLTT